MSVQELHWATCDVCGEDYVDVDNDDVCIHCRSAGARFADRWMSDLVAGGRMPRIEAAAVVGIPVLWAVA